MNKWPVDLNLNWKFQLNNQEDLAATIVGELCAIMLNMNIWRPMRPQILINTYFFEIRNS